MVAQHAACLIALTTASTRAVTADLGGELGAPEIGLPVLMFAGELAVVVQPAEHRDQQPDSLVAASEQAVTTATSPPPDASQAWSTPSRPCRHSPANKHRDLQSACEVTKSARQ
jgi:hypothetical protein